MKRQTQFETIRSEGGLLPIDLLQRVREPDKDLGGLRGEDYGLPPNEPLNEAIVRSWNRLVGAWGSFQEARAKLADDDPGTTITRERWLLVLLHELGYGRVQTASAVVIDGKSYAVSHAWAPSPVPIHLVGCKVKLDIRSRGVAGASTQSPHGTLQELLNRSDERVWGIVSNGLLLRLLRDNSSLTRQAYIEFDLEAMLDGEAYADFALLWLVCHASRVEGERSHDCWLEKWSQEAARQGTRALDGLRSGVETAITALGSGFLQPGANPQLKEALRSGELSTQDYYRQLLRLVYRLLFLFVAEDRQLLHDPASSDEARERYARWYSTARLRDLAGKRRGTKHTDLWHALRLVMGGLGSDHGCPALGLPALGGYLWSRESIQDIDGAALANRSLLEAVRALATVRDAKVLRAVDYRNLGAEELGSVYESLLELHPRLDADAGTFALFIAAGNERKTTGSYYTPTTLISCLLDSALDPVLDEATAKGEEAILDLKVCDPACGSGHFLVAAGHRIARRLASIRTGDEEPSPEATRHALRDVVSRCLYGVDVNPMAVELCKVSLWMEALDPGRPLSFLDAHIKCGNSLLGTTVELIGGGVPDDAFKALAGDDKEVARSLRAQNREERKGQLSLEDAGGIPLSELEQRTAAVEAAGDDSVESLHEQERRLEQLLSSHPYERAKLTADAWCAAFVQPKKPFAPRLTTSVVRRAASGASMPDEIIENVRKLQEQYEFFHWEIEFPQVFGRPEHGFDVILGNPPWERVKLQEKEYFSGHPEIAGARNASHRKERIAALREQDSTLFAAWTLALRKAEGESHFIRTSGRYPLCGRGDVNTYALFAELDRSLVGDRGRFGSIFPTGIATDLTTSAFFSSLVEEEMLVSLFDFRNHDGLFYDVGHRTFKFCLLTAAGSGCTMAEPHFVFWAEESTDVHDPTRRYSLARDDFRLLNPNSGSCPAFRSRQEAELIMAIYRRVPVLLREGASDGNPWGVSFMTMLHMANDSSLFHAEAASDRARLYEAKMIHQFTHRWATYENGETRPPTEKELKDPGFSPTPLWYVDRREVTGRLASRTTSAWLLGWRDIARPANVRTVISSVLPLEGVGHNMPLAFVSSGKPALFLANLNSFVLDFVAKRKIGGTHVTYFVLQQLPVLPPSAFERPAPWSSEGTVGDWLLPRIVELVYTSLDVRAFATENGYTGEPFVWSDNRRRLLRAELDAAFFHLYGLDEAEVSYVMDTFTIVRRLDTERDGYYRTRELILEAYRGMRHAIESGVGYETFLDAPPVDLRPSHLSTPAAG